MSDTASPVELSVIIPVGGRFSDPVELYAAYRAGLDALGRTYETIFVLDGPRESFAAGLRTLAADGNRLTVVSLTRTFGEATALMAGFEQAAGKVILTLPAYPQIDGSDLHKLVSALESCDLAVARRWPRAG